MMFRKIRLVIVGLCCFALVGVVFAQTAGDAAIMVYGQPDFSSGAINHGADVLDGNGFNYPLGIVADASNGFYMADRNNHRVLYFANDGDANPDRVYGQFGGFSAHIVNNDGKGNSGAPSPDNLANPTALAMDSAGGLYVADRDNHRVLYFANDGNTSADRVYGQFGKFVTNMTDNDSTANYGEPSADNVGTYVLGLAVDSQGGLYVSDSSNHRVLYFANDGDTTADRVYGQFNNFASAVRNNDGQGKIGTPSANSLNFPRGLAVDSSDGLWVADRDNNRVLYFANDGDTTADRVYGQFGSYSSVVEGNDGSGNAGAPNTDNLSHPKAVLPTADGLWIADSIHNRLLHFSGDSTTADRVYGQFGSFTVDVVNNDGSGNAGTPSASNLSLPQGLAMTGDGRLLLTDTANNRVLVYQMGG
jgi:NHL repeat